MEIKNCLGKKHSSEWKKQLSERMKGNKFNLSRKISKEAKERLLSYAIGNKVNLGRHPSEETRRKLSEAHRGENSWQWKRGMRSKPYGIEWTATLRRLIRERDENTCQLCGVQQESKLFDVHHIDYDKTNNDYENLITLCSECHRKTIHCNDKDYWISFFRDYRTTGTVTIKMGSVLRYRKVS